jgi:hypothetical protein
LINNIKRLKQTQKDMIFFKEIQEALFNTLRDKDKLQKKLTNALQTKDKL